jgi:hypothetical protein
MSDETNATPTVPEVPTDPTVFVNCPRTGKKMITKESRVPELNRLMAEINKRGGYDYDRDVELRKGKDGHVFPYLGSLCVVLAKNMGLPYKPCPDGRIEIRRKKAAERKQALKKRKAAKPTPVTDPLAEPRETYKNALLTQRAKLMFTRVELQNALNRVDADLSTTDEALERIKSEAEQLSQAPAPLRETM